MKFCLIGCGGIAMSAHAPSYALYRAQNPDFELTACCDPAPGRAEAMRARFGFARSYTSHAEMLANEKPDCAAVIVSVNAAYAVGLDVLRAGVPMLIEKPPGRSSAETQNLADTAKRLGVPNQVAFNRRYTPALVQMRRALENIAPPEGIQTIAYDFYRFDRFDANFSDTAIHGIDAARYLARSDYKRVCYEYQELKRYGEGVCNIYMHAEMECGARVQLQFCPVSGIVLERATAHARAHTLIAYAPVSGSTNAQAQFERYEAGNPVETVHGENEAGFIANGFYAENAAFFGALKTGKPPEPSIASALNTMRVKECIDRRAPEYLEE